MKKAYYYASKKTKFVVVYGVDGSELFSRNVSGKAEARKVAEGSDATCWNF